MLISYISSSSKVISSLNALITEACFRAFGLWMLLNIRAAQSRDAMLLLKQAWICCLVLLFTYSGEERSEA